MNTLRFFLPISLIFAVSQSFASGYVGNKEIVVMTTAYDSVLLNFDSPGNPDGCSQPNVILEPSHVRFDEMYAILLTAYTTGRKVNIFVSGCDSVGFKKAHFVRAVWD